MIAYETSHDGRSARVYRMVRQPNGNYLLPTLGHVTGGDPLDTFINAALEYTEHDAELYSLISRVIERRVNDLATAFGNAGRCLDHALDDLADMIAALRQRYV